MSTIEDQIELEKRMVAYGITRYRGTVEAAESKDRTADTQYSQVLMREFLEPVSKALEEYCLSTKSGVNAKYKVLLRTVDPAKAAYFGLRCLFNHFTQDSTLHKLANHIGTMIEDEVRFAKFHDEHNDYYETIIRDFARKGTKSYRHMHRVLTHKANALSVQWNTWPVQDKICVGTKVLDMILSETDLVEKKISKTKGKTIVKIIPSQSALDWIQDYLKYAELLNPDRVPCVIPPDDWTSIYDGGYYTPQMRNRTPMVKTRSPEHKELFQGDIEAITTAINTIQNVPWSINKEVFDVLQNAWENSIPVGLPRSEPHIIPDSPVSGKSKAEFTEHDKQLFEDWKAEARMVHSMEKDRISKCFQVVRVVRLANEFKDLNKFWYVYQCDF